MANLDNAKGLIPVGHLNGTSNGGSWMCYVASGYATALYVGDPVIHAGAACTTGCCMTIGIATATAGNQVLGAIVNFEPVGPTLAGWTVSLDPTGVDRAGSLPYSPASTERYANVCIDPDTIYEIQGDTDTALSKASVSSNADLVSGTGSTVTGYSGWELDASGATTTLNLQLHILRAVNRPDNDPSLIHAKWEVLLNMGVFGGALGRITGV